LDGYGGVALVLKNEILILILKNQFYPGFSTPTAFNDFKDVWRRLEVRN